MIGDFLVAVILSVPFAIFAAYDVRMAGRLRKAAARRPKIPTLTLTSHLVTGIAISAVLATVLGVSSAVFAVTGVRLLPTPLPLVILYALIVIPSIVVIPLTRAVSEWERRPTEPES